MAKFERRSIRIAGKVINSPRFPGGKDGKRLADEWYSKKAAEKEFIEDGLMTSDSPTFFRYAQKWFAKRKKAYPKSTWAADETRLRKYLLPLLSEVPMNKISRTLIRDVIVKAQEENDLSQGTRTLIKALASKIFNDAMNENPPLVHFNPCAKLTFTESRRGKKKPATLQDGDEVRTFLRVAASIGKREVLVCAIAVMAGLRKSEIIALRYSNILPTGRILIDHHCEAASLSIKPGTKAGSEETREVAIPAMLMDMIERHREESDFNAESDFIICDETGEWVRPRMLHTMIKRVIEEFGRPINLHNLRHTYGRIFMSRTGNQQALKDLLGHKSLSTTMIYSELSGQQLQPFGEMMNFEAPKLLSESVRVTPKRHQKKKKAEES